eukprot:TRINITY_DN34949_c0_g1_i1.p2 TRINITY_DN34949_c0_g1~~TRINITY_DN34949_c0_g1_i1.p2  ORF type:complete len:110 (-),score=8.60 TRINITY_DN34949_c0_g1_i1:86-415(-)
MTMRVENDAVSVSSESDSGEINTASFASPKQVISEASLVAFLQKERKLTAPVDDKGKHQYSAWYRQAVTLSLVSKDSKAAIAKKWILGSGIDKKKEEMFRRWPHNHCRD